MTVSSTTAKVSYDGDGSTKIFSYTFKIFDEDDIAVYIYDTVTGTSALQTITTHYTVTGVGGSGGGTVVFTAAPAADETVILLRAQPLKQETDYTENDAFAAETHEEALDKLTMGLQTLNEKVSRSFKLPVSDTTADPTVPDGTVYAGKYLKWNDAGTALEAVAVDSLSGTFADVVSDTSPQLGGDLDTNSFDIAITSASTVIKELSTNAKFLSFTKVTSAVNYIDLSQAATGNNPTFTAVGGDTNITITIAGKGTGGVDITGPLDVTGAGTFGGAVSVTGAISATSTASVVGSITVAGTAAGGSYIELREDTDNGTNYVRHAASDTLSGDTTYKWPAAPGSDKILHSDSSGNLSWEDAPSFTLPNASQSQMEAGTSNAVAATPGNLFYHPLCLRAWARVVRSSGSVSLGQSSGISGISGVSNDFTLTFSSTYSSNPSIVAFVMCSAVNATTIERSSVSTTQANLKPASTTDWDYIIVLVLGGTV